MSANQWVYELATGKWMLGFRDPSVYLTDQTNYHLVDLGDNQPPPDPITERFAAGSGRRAATAAEILDSQNERLHLLAQAQIDSWPLDLRSLLLTLLDEINRLRTQPTATFSTITPAQAMAAVRAKAGTL